MTNQYEAAHRARKVEAIVGAMLALPEVAGDITAIPVEQMEAFTPEQVADWSVTVARITAPSVETWRQACASVRIRQKCATEAAKPGFDPFAGL